MFCLSSGICLFSSLLFMSHIGTHTLSFICGCLHKTFFFLPNMLSNKVYVRELTYTLFYTYFCSLRDVCFAFFFHFKLSPSMWICDPLYLNCDTYIHTWCILDDVTLKLWIFFNHFPFFYIIFATKVLNWEKKHLVSNRFWKHIFLVFIFLTIVSKLTKRIMKQYMRKKLYSL